MSATGKPDLNMPMKMFKEQKAWDAWLARNHDTSAGLWLRLAKKGANLQSLSYGEALEAALCYGWIDGQKKRWDEASWLQKFTPRGPRSIWSKVNRAKALELVEQGRMQAAGLAAIERAKANGRWAAAYDSQRTARVPPEFEAALVQHPKAKAFFETLNSRNRYAILFRIQNAKKVETRQRHIDQFIRMLERNQKLYP